MSPYANKEKQRAAHHAYYVGHKNALLAKGKDWYERNKDRVRLRNKEYRESHKDEIRAKLRAKHEANPEIRRAEGRAYYAKNKKQILGNWVRRQYGLGPQEMADLLKSQGGRCAICQSDSWGHKGPMVDHDHKPGGKVRGLLCHHCNSALGLIRDNPKIAESIIRYLQKERP